MIGLLATLTARDNGWLVSTDVRAFLMVGICGGYTTFSSFSLQTLNFMRDGKFLFAGANVLISVAICLFCVWLGHLSGVALTK